jgi:hypothetical protein
MRIVYAIILAVSLIGCDDGKKDGVVSQSGVKSNRPELSPDSAVDFAKKQLDINKALFDASKAKLEENSASISRIESEVAQAEISRKRAEKELLQARRIADTNRDEVIGIVKTRIPPLPHRAFKIAVESIPEEHSLQSIQTARTILTAIPIAQIPTELHTAMSTLVNALYREMADGLTLGRNLIRTIVLASPIQYSIPRRAIEFAHALRASRRDNSPSSHFLQGQLIEALGQISDSEGPYVRDFFSRLRAFQNSLTTTPDAQMPDDLINLIDPDPSPVPLDILDAVRRVSQLPESDPVRLFEAFTGLLGIIDNAHLPAGSVVAAAKETFDGSSRQLKQVTDDAKGACVDLFTHLNTEDVLYDAIDSYSAISSPSLEDKQRLINVIGTIPQDRRSQIQVELGEYLRAKEAVNTFQVEVGIAADRKAILESQLIDLQTVKENLMSQIDTATRNYFEAKRKFEALNN